VESTVDLAATFAAKPNASPLAGLPDAWHWSLARGLDFAATLSQDGTHVFQCFALHGCYDERLVTDVLAFARAHEMLASPLVVVEGFTSPDRAFDTVVAFGPTVHRHHEDNPELRQAIRAVQPAYRCEFAGDESEDDTRYRFGRAAGVPTTRLNREPRPYLKMRHKTDTRVIPERFFVGVGTLVVELRRLADRVGGFVEFENYRHEVRRVEWAAGRWHITDEAPMELDALLEFTKATLYGPNLAAGTSEFPS
jgi:hypothetical protein